jgi:hypothetical protein
MLGWPGLIVSRPVHIMPGENTDARTSSTCSRIVVGLVLGLAVIAILLGMRLFRFGRPAIASTSPTEY